MERLEREIERIIRGCGGIIEKTARRPDGNGEPRSAEEIERKTKKIIISFSVFFTQNQLPFKPKDIYEMDIDDLLITYEIILQQIEEKRKLADGIKI
jgi:hypothetical protein